MTTDARFNTHYFLGWIFCNGGYQAARNPTNGRETIEQPI